MRHTLRRQENELGFIWPSEVTLAEDCYSCVILSFYSSILMLCSEPQRKPMTQLRNHLRKELRRYRNLYSSPGSDRA